MPKRGKKGKKKSVVVNPEIKIVDEGQSSFAVEDAIRQKTASVRSQPPIEKASEAEESSNFPVEGENADMNSFTISEVTSMRKFDTLGVIGKKDSINSNFSFFSDNNLTATADLEEVEAHHFEETKITFSHFAESRSTNLQSLKSFDGTETESLKIDEFEDKDQQNGSNNLLMLPQDFSMSFREENKNIEWHEAETERITDKEDQTDSFLMELEREISADSNETEEKDEASSFSSIEMDTGENDNILNDIKTETIEDKSTNSQTILERKTKVGWDNIQIKREIKIGFKEPVPGDTLVTELKDKIIQQLDNKIYQGASQLFYCNEKNVIPTDDTENGANILFLEDCPFDFKKVYIYYQTLIVTYDKGSLQKKVCLAFKVQY